MKVPEKFASNSSLISEIFKTIFSKGFIYPAHFGFMKVQKSNRQYRCIQSYDNKLMASLRTCTGVL